ncbi:Rnf-Nqr domain containing protein [Oscillospiraceae bacterium MB08-C2-2]|nr:Rnf-Nqr domain containing protein [Oscillospiraceae bacterium MB08-C2-2]
MEAIVQFFLMALAAAAGENALLSRGLGLSKAPLSINSIKMGILYGGLMTTVSTVSSFLTYLVGLFFQGRPYAPYIRPICFALMVGLVYAGVYLLCKKYLPAYFKSVETLLPLASFNSALFGAIYMSLSQRHTLAQTIGYAFGTGMGFTAAMLIVYLARKRLSISHVPRAFRGLPIVLLYIGLLSLAIFSLVGHELPT